MSDISKINVGGTEYNIKDATARTETQPISRGGTGATTAAGALSNLGAVSKSGDTINGALTINAMAWAGFEFLYDTNSGVFFRSKQDNLSYCGGSGKRWVAVYSANGVITGSDRRLKKDINDDFSKLANVFAKLRPVTFEYADTKDGLTRIGFIAQEVEQAMAGEGLNADDFAFLKKDAIDEDSEMAKFIGDTTVYSLNYSEFIALNTYMIQQQQIKINDLEARLSALEARLTDGNSN